MSKLETVAVSRKKSFNQMQHPFETPENPEEESPRLARADFSKK